MARMVRSPRATDGRAGVSEVEEGVKGEAWVAAASPETARVHGGDDGGLLESSMAAADPASSEQKEGGGGLDLGQGNLLDEKEWRKGCNEANGGFTFLELC